MTLIEAVIIAIVEGLTEYLPISSTAHMIFTSSFFGIEEEEFVKMYQISIQFGAILAVVVYYWKKFFNFKHPSFYIRLAIAVIPALVLGYLFDDYIETALESPMAIAVVLIIGGVILLFIDKIFTHPTVFKDSEISYKKAFIIGIWQCLAMMPGMSRSAASIIGGMQQKLSREVAAEFSFFLAVPTMLAATTYSIFIKNWHIQGVPTKGYEMIMSTPSNTQLFVVGNLVAFFVALLAIKLFIDMIKKYGFKPWGYYRIIAGVLLLIYFWKYNV